MCRERLRNYLLCCDAAFLRQMRPLVGLATAQNNGCVCLLLVALGEPLGEEVVWVAEIRKCVRNYRTVTVHHVFLWYSKLCVCVCTVANPVELIV